MAETLIDGLEDSDGIVNRIAPVGEYELEVTSAKDKETGPTSKHPGSPMLSLTFKVRDDDYPVTVFHNFMIPSGKALEWMTSEDKRRNMAAIKRFKMACGLPNDNRVSPELFMHCTFKAKVGIGKDMKGDDCNRIVDFVV